MKYVREHINEKFTQESDPIKDLGIGIRHKLKKFYKKIREERGYRADIAKLSISKKLSWAAYYNEFEIVEYLLSKGAKFHLDSSHDALCFAAVAGNIEMALFLIEKGQDLEEAIKFANNNCNFKTQAGLKKVKEEWLKRNNALVNEKFTQESDPIKDLNIGMIHVIEHFLNYKSRYKIDNNNGELNKPKDYLWMCVAENKIKYVEYLLDNGWNIHHEEDRALRCAAYKGNYKMTKFLLERGANPKEGIYHAKYFDHKDVLKLLKQYINK